MINSISKTRYLPQRRGDAEKNDTKYLKVFSGPLRLCGGGSSFSIISITLRLLQNSLSSPKCSIGDMVSYNKTPDSRLNNAGMTIFLYFCKRLTLLTLIFVGISFAEREVKAEDVFTKGSTSHFTAQFEAKTDKAIAEKIIALLEQAYSDVNIDMAHFPSGKTIVILHEGKGSKEAAQPPDCSGVVNDGKIRLPMGGVKDISAQLKAVIYHEYSHVVVRSMTRGKMAPTWLNEGIAEYEGSRFSERNMKELTRAAKKGELIPVKRLESPFSGLSDKELSLAYLQSYSLVKYIIDRFGFHAVRDILDNIDRGDNIETAIKKALDPFELDYASLVGEWEGTLK